MTKDHQNNNFDTIDIDWIGSESDEKTANTKQVNNSKTARTTQTSEDRKPIESNTTSSYTRRARSSFIDEHNQVLWDDVDGIMIGQQVATSISTPPALAAKAQVAPQTDQTGNINMER